LRIGLLTALLRFCVFFPRREQTKETKERMTGRRRLVPMERATTMEGHL
jgi:hypothetical protein